MFTTNNYDIDNSNDKKDNEHEGFEEYQSK